MILRTTILGLTLALAIAGAAPATRAASEARITIEAGKEGHRISRYLTGACLEDVNHEIYGGIYSQMLYGEHFAEPAPPPVIKGFTRLGGEWRPEGGVLQAAAGDGPKLVANDSEIDDGEASVSIRFAEVAPGNAGMVVRASEAAEGADRFSGYEISLDTAGKLILGRHRQNWEPIREVPCEVPVGKWIELTVRLQGPVIEVLVDGKSVTRFEDREHPLAKGRVALRTWKRSAEFRDLSVVRNGKPVRLPFVVDGAASDEVSGAWRAVRKGNAVGKFALAKSPDSEIAHLQDITFVSGEGEVGIENQGLGRRGLNLVAGQPYEGRICVADGDACEVALESADGSKVYARKQISISNNPLNVILPIGFTLLPDQSDPRGRLIIKLVRPGKLHVRYAILEPGPWGRFHDQPVRKDVGEALVDQGLTVMRLGGCMANAPGYKWKHMTAPDPDFRPPYKGWWNPYSSNGWGIFDFLSFCEAAGMLAIPDLNMDETAEDAGQFIECVNGPTNGSWGGARAYFGHPAPYGLKILQLGNEEKVDAAYFAKFKPLAEAVWAQDKDIILVVGDFAYQNRIEDPDHVTGADSHIPNLEAHRQILRLAKEHNREVWFDVHVWTDGPRPTPSLDGAISFRDALEKIADGARFQVVVFELNANNHAQRRALANALAIQRFERDGRFPVVCSANCLQVDGLNDNGWDQGLLFLDPQKVWMQPPGYVTRMISRHYQPVFVPATVEGGGSNLDVSAKRSEDGKTLVVQVVNLADDPCAADIDLRGFVPQDPTATIETLSGPLEAVNTAENPQAIVPKTEEWPHGYRGGTVKRTLDPRSFTVLVFH